MKKEDVRKVVSEGYAQVAKGGSSSCAPQNPCCGTTKVAIDISKRIGYTDEDIQSAPEGANLGLGCGNPVAVASLKEGEDRPLSAGLTPRRWMNLLSFSSSQSTFDFL